jgi:tetratricopeptide (TPR) repeat protein
MMAIKLYKVKTIPSKYSALLVSLLLLLALSGPAAAQDDPSDKAIALFGRGQDLHEKGDLKGAIAEYDKALKILPAFPEAEYQRAAAEISMGDLAEAEGSVRRALDARPDWSLAWGMLGDVLVRKYSRAPAADRGALFADAIAALDRAIELDKANVPAYTALVDLRLNSGADAEKLRDLLARVRALTDGKASPAASLWTARSALEQALGDAANAKASLDRALELDPRNPSTIFAAAGLAVAKRDLETAKALSARLAGQAGDADRLNALNAAIAAAEGRFDDALKLLDAMKQPTREATALKTQIAVLRSQNPADLEKQFAAEPKNADIPRRLCSMYRRSDPLKALEYCRRASELDPSDLNNAVGFAAALVQARQFPQAIGLIQRLMTLAPDNATLHANLATAFFELKRYPEALTEFEWLAHANPAMAAPYLFLGIIHDRQMEYVDSLSAYEQYLRLADPIANKDDLDKINLRLPTVRALVKDGKGKKSRL